MSPDRFEHLLSLVGPLISKKSTRMREPISEAERLTLTLRFLASGDDQQSLAFSFRLGRTTVSHILRETCSAIWKALGEIYLKPPSSPDDWQAISKDFEELWNLPHCVGAIDGKHINMQCPNNSGSLFYNYKGFFSLVLMAVCDAHYNFTLVDIGDYGSNNDSGVLSHSEMGKAIDDGSINFPKPEHLEGCDLPLLPYFLVGDEAFGLKPWLQRPYPGKSLTEPMQIFNYRLSRARRVIENVFGILRARWRVFKGPISASPKTVQLIIEAAVCLHNYLRQTETALYCPSGFVDSMDRSGNIKPGEWRSMVSTTERGALDGLSRVRGSRYTLNAIQIRKALTDFLNSEQGAVSWQWAHVRSTGPLAT